MKPHQIAMHKWVTLLVGERSAVAQLLERWTEDRRVAPEPPPGESPCCVLEQDLVGLLVQIGKAGTRPDITEGT